MLYLGRKHPLKGIEYLEQAVAGLPNVELRIVSDAQGEELERVWQWCEVLVLPTLSENFGRVVAEALERGKRVITTDGAPAWEDGNSYGGRLVCLKGYRDGTDAERVELLKKAIERICK
ncbi:MAG: glycosyltransferase [Kiritimatiellae bacterium]|nr:glycosyltransferase [Kiritimatiellia bacterium]MBQ8126696.1 glycosyltransferase [Kiritimatiellia bacterium]